MGSIYDREGNVRTDMSDREVSSKIWKWAIATVVLLFVVLPLAVWGFNAAFAPEIGRINQQTVINNPLNQISQYNHFFDLDAAIKTHQTEIKNGVAQQSAFNKANPSGTADPTGQITQARLQLSSSITGAANLCTDAANAYNNDAKTYTKGNFLDKNLPTNEDPTQCEVPTS